MDDRRRKELEDFNRNHIVQAALREFSRKGFQRTTVDSIARRAGYSPAAIYRYFDSKTSLFAAVMQTIREETMVVLNEPLPDTLGFEAKLRARLSRYLIFAEKNKGHLAALLSQRGLMEWDLGNYPQKAVRDFYSSYRAAFSELVHVAIREGTLRLDAPDFYATALVGLIDAFGYQWLTNPGNEPLRSRVDRIVDLFMRGASIVLSEFE